MTASWVFWALPSALFGAAIMPFGKLGIAGISSDLGAFIHILVVVPSLALVLWSTGQAAQVAIDKLSVVFIALFEVVCLGAPPILLTGLASSFKPARC